MRRARSTAARASTRVLVTHGHRRSRRRRAGDRRGASGRARSPNIPGRRRTRRYAVAWQPLGDGEAVTAGGRDADRAAHARTLAGSHRVLARADAHDLHRRPRRPGRQRHDPLEPRRRSRRSISRRSSGCSRSSRARLLPGARPGDRRSARGPDAATSSTGACGSGRCIDALRAGHATVPAIAESIYDGLAPALMPAARENVRAHLEKLKTREAGRRDDDGRLDALTRQLDGAPRHGQRHRLHQRQPRSLPRRAESAARDSRASARCPSTPATSSAAPSGAPTRCGASACRTSG